MKAGLVFADMLSTVSPTYAREIQTPLLGCGLDGLLRERQADLRGIVNGIETQIWSPAHEPMLAQPLRQHDVSRGEGRVQGLAAGDSRTSRSPGDPAPRADRPARSPERMGPAGRGRRPAARPGRAAVVLGTGHPKYHQLLEELARRHEGKLWAHLGFSDDLAHQIEAGADLFLMPSLYEPCGLNQLYSLAHGTVPLVSVDWRACRHRGQPRRRGPWPTARPMDLSSSSRPPRPLGGDRAGPGNLARSRRLGMQLVRNGMEADWSWDHSAGEYERLYGEIVRRVQPSSAQSGSPRTGAPVAEDQIALKLAARCSEHIPSSDRYLSPMDSPFHDPRVSDGNSIPGPDVAPAPTLLSRRRRG